MFTLRSQVAVAILLLATTQLGEGTSQPPVVWENCTSAGDSWRDAKPGICHQDYDFDSSPIPAYTMYLSNSIEECNHVCGIWCKAFSVTTNDVDDTGEYMCLLHFDNADNRGNVLRRGVVDVMLYNGQPDLLQGCSLPEDKSVTDRDYATGVPTVPFPINHNITTKAWCKVFGHWVLSGKWLHESLYAPHDFRISRNGEYAISSDAGGQAPEVLIASKPLRTVVFDIELGIESPTWSCFNGVLDFGTTRNVHIKEDNPSFIHWGGIEEDIMEATLDIGSLEIQKVPNFVTLSNTERYAVYCYIYLSTSTSERTGHDGQGRGRDHQRKLFQMGTDTAKNCTLLDLDGGEVIADGEIRYPYATSSTFFYTRSGTSIGGVDRQHSWFAPDDSSAIMLSLVGYRCVIFSPPHDVPRVQDPLRPPNAFPCRIMLFPKSGDYVYCMVPLGVQIKDTLYEAVEFWAYMPKTDAWINLGTPTPTTDLGLTWNFVQDRTSLNTDHFALSDDGKKFMGILVGSWDGHDDEERTIAWEYDIDIQQWMHLQGFDANKSLKAIGYHKDWYMIINGPCQHLADCYSGDLLICPRRSQETCSPQTAFSVMGLEEVYPMQGNTVLIRGTSEVGTYDLGDPATFPNSVGYVYSYPIGAVALATSPSGQQYVVMDFALDLTISTQRNERGARFHSFQNGDQHIANTPAREFNASLSSDERAQIEDHIQNEGLGTWNDVLGWALPSRYFRGMCAQPAKSTHSCAESEPPHYSFPSPHYLFTNLTEQQCSQLCDPVSQVLQEAGYFEDAPPLPLCDAVDWVPPLGCRVISQHDEWSPANLVISNINFAKSSPILWESDPEDLIEDFSCFIKGTDTPTPTPTSTATGTSTPSLEPTKTYTNTQTPIPTATPTNTATVKFQICEEGLALDIGQPAVITSLGDYDLCFVQLPTKLKQASNPGSGRVLSYQLTLNVPPHISLTVYVNGQEDEVTGTFEIIVQNISNVRILAKEYGNVPEGEKFEPLQDDGSLSLSVSEVFHPATWVKLVTLSAAVILIIVGTIAGFMYAHQRKKKIAELRKHVENLRTIDETMSDLSFNTVDSGYVLKRTVGAFGISCLLAGLVCFAVGMSLWNQKGDVPWIVNAGLIVIGISILVILGVIMWISWHGRRVCPACNELTMPFRFLTRPVWDAKIQPVTSDGPMEDQDNAVDLSDAAVNAMQGINEKLSRSWRFHFRGVFHPRCAKCVLCTSTVTRRCWPGADHARLIHDECWQDKVKELLNDSVAKLQPWMEHGPPADTEMAHAAARFLRAGKMEELAAVLETRPHLVESKLVGMEKKYLLQCAIALGSLESVRCILESTRDPLNPIHLDFETCEQTYGYTVQLADNSEEMDEADEDTASESSKSTSKSTTDPEASKIEQEIDIYLWQPFVVYNGFEVYRGITGGRYLFVVESETERNWYTSPSLGEIFGSQPIAGIPTDPESPLSPNVQGQARWARKDQEVDLDAVVLDDQKTKAPTLQAIRIRGYKSCLEQAMFQGKLDILQLLMDEYKLRYESDLIFQFRDSMGSWIDYDAEIQKAIQEVNSQDLEESKVEIWNPLNVNEHATIDLVAYCQRNPEREFPIRGIMRRVVRHHPTEACKTRLVFSSLILAQKATVITNTEMLNALIAKGFTMPLEWVVNARVHRGYQRCMHETLHRIWSKEITLFLRQNGLPPSSQSQDLLSVQIASGLDQVRGGRFSLDGQNGNGRGQPSEENGMVDEQGHAEEHGHALHTDGLDNPEYVTKDDVIRNFYPQSYQPKVRLTTFIAELSKNDFGYKFPQKRILELLINFTMKVDELRAQSVNQEEVKIIDSHHLLSIYTYTYELVGDMNEEVDQIYSVLNRAMRSKEKQEIVFWRPLMYYLDQALAMLPEFIGRTYRGINMSFPTGYDKDACVLWTAYSSSSTKRSVAEEFAFASSNCERATLFFLGSSGARDISAYSRFAGEGEVLYLGNSCFRVRNVLQCDTAIGGFYAQCDNIEMDELERSEMGDVSDRDRYFEFIKGFQRHGGFVSKMHQSKHRCDKGMALQPENHHMLANICGLLFAPNKAPPLGYAQMYARQHSISISKLNKSTEHSPRSSVWDPEDKVDSPIQSPAKTKGSDTKGIEVVQGWSFAREPSCAVDPKEIETVSVLQTDSGTKVNYEELPWHGTAGVMFHPRASNTNALEPPLTYSVPNSHTSSYAVLGFQGPYSPKLAYTPANLPAFKDDISGSSDHSSATPTPTPTDPNFMPV